MSIEENIFKKAVADFDKLLTYGFVKEKEGFSFEKVFMNGQFIAVVNVDSDGKVSGNVYDTATDDIYFPMRVNTPSAGFALKVRAEYEKILTDIKDNCFRLNCFIGTQANRLACLILQKYRAEPEFPWEKYENYGVFKNQNSGKWYALIMNIDKSKLQKDLSGEIEVANLKIAEDKIPLLLKKKGFFPAWHMNKKSWITVTLDDTLTDAEIMELISESYGYSENGKKIRKGTISWILPSNVRYFDVKATFKVGGEMMWKQSSDVKVGDIAYMYASAPYSAILYKCVVTEVNVPYNYADENIKITKVLKAKIVKEYADDFMPFSRLKEYGVKAVRGPRTCPDELTALLG